MAIMGALGDSQTQINWQRQGDPITLISQKGEQTLDCLSSMNFCWWLIDLLDLTEHRLIEM